MIESKLLSFNEFNITFKHNNTCEAIAKITTKFSELKHEEIQDIYDSEYLSVTRKGIKTVGILQPIVHTGGTARVAVLLISLWLRLGFKVILFTENNCSISYSISESVTQVIIPKVRDKSNYCDVLERCKCVRSLLIKFNIDVFVSNRDSSLYDLLCIKTIGIPYLIIQHNPFILNMLRFPQDQGLYQLTDMVITLTEKDKVYCNMLGINSAYIPNPIDEALVSAPLCNLDSKNIIWVGRLHPTEKRPGDALDVINKIIKEIPMAKLYMLGTSGSDQFDKHFEKIINQKRLVNSVVWTGFQPNVYAFYQNSSVLLMTSAFESYSMVAMEAMAFGLPCVTYEMPDLIYNHRDGGAVLVRQRDVVGAADMIINLFRDKKQHQKLSNDAKASFNNLKKIDTGVLWIETFDKVLGTNRRQPIVPISNINFSEIINTINYYHNYEMNRNLYESNYNVNGIKWSV